MNGAPPTKSAACGYEGPFSMKLRTSVFVTLPLLPVEVIWLMSMLCSFARCLTAGVERALDLELPEIYKFILRVKYTQIENKFYTYLGQLKKELG